MASGRSGTLHFRLGLCQGGLRDLIVGRGSLDLLPPHRLGREEPFRPLLRAARIVRRRPARVQLGPGLVKIGSGCARLAALQRDQWVAPAHHVPELDVHGDDSGLNGSSEPFGAVLVR